MPKTIAIVTGSMRPNSAGASLLPTVQAAVEAADMTATVVDIRTAELPFFNDSHTPSQEGFAPSDPAVQRWAHTVAAADAVIMLTPEYNGQLSGAQKNAIDWLHKEWHNKPVGIVAYGWYAGRGSEAQLVALLKRLKARPVVAQGLTFLQDISTSGEPLATGQAQSSITTLINTIVKGI